MFPILQDDAVKPILALAGLCIRAHGQPNFQASERGKRPKVTNRFHGPLGLQPHVARRTVRLGHLLIATSTVQHDDGFAFKLGV